MLQRINNDKLFIQLASEFDFSRLESFSKSDLFNENVRPYANCFYEVNDLRSAQVLCIGFIKYFDLSASNWTGGLVVNEHNEFMAIVSYNGRIWDNEDWKIAKEIKLC